MSSLTEGRHRWEVNVDPYHLPTYEATFRIIEGERVAWVSGFYKLMHLVILEAERDGWDVVSMHQHTEWPVSIERYLLKKRSDASP